MLIAQAVFLLECGQRNRESHKVTKYRHNDNNTRLTAISPGQQHPFNGHFSGTSQMSRYWKGKTSLDLLEQETENGSGISRAICNSTPDR